MSWITHAPSTPPPLPSNPSEIVASKDVYKQVILPRTGVAFIPVLVCPDSTTVLQDSHSIMWHLEQHHPQHPVLPRTPKHRAAAMLLELYGDEWLLLPAMHYRWSFPQQHTTYMHYQFGEQSTAKRLQLLQCWMLFVQLTAGFAPPAADT